MAARGAVFFGATAFAGFFFAVVFAAAVLGAFFVLLIPEVLNSFVGALGPEYAAQLAAWRNVVFGGLILLFLVLEPLGLVGLWGRVRDYFRTWPLPY